MKRELHASLGGHGITLAATFRASVEISDTIADPLEIAREAAIEQMMTQIGQVYDPRFRFTVKNVPKILHIGQAAAGGKRSLEEMQELVFDAGFIEGKTVALNYLALIVQPQSDEAEKDAKTGGTAPGE